MSELIHASMSSYTVTFLGDRMIAGSIEEAVIWMRGRAQALQYYDEGAYDAAMKAIDRNEFKDEWAEVIAIDPDSGRPIGMSVKLNDKNYRRSHRSEAYHRHRRYIMKLKGDPNSRNHHFPKLLTAEEVVFLQKCLDKKREKEQMNNQGEDQ